MADLTRLITVAVTSVYDFTPAGGDAYVLKHVIHDWDDESAVGILKNCHRAMGEQGKLLIIEGVYPPRLDQSPQGSGRSCR